LTSDIDLATGKQIDSKPRSCLTVVTEEKLPKPKSTSSVPSLLNLPNGNNNTLYRKPELKPSENAKKYVKDIFAEPYQTEILQAFNFNLLD
jgi:hypothetical protein